MAAMFKQMDSSPRVQRVKGFISEAANALHSTLNGIVDLIELTLSKNCVYILPGMFSSNRIEAEPGLCCLSSSNNYLLSMEQVASSTTSTYEILFQIRYSITRS